MKKKDIIALIVALGILVGAGYLYMSMNKPAGSKAASAASAEIVPVIDGKLDPEEVLPNLDAKYEVRDYKQAFEIEQGLKNPAPFSR